MYNIEGMLFLLVFGHCLADTSLQTSFMAKGKNRNNPIDMSNVPLGQKPLNLWWMWLLHHSVIHGGIVYLITGSLSFGIAEVLSHWLIDYFKCENAYSPFEDQLLHLSMKVLYIVLI